MSPRIHLELVCSSASVHQVGKADSHCQPRGERNKKQLAMGENDNGNFEQKMYEKRKMLSFLRFYSVLCEIFRCLQNFHHFKIGASPFIFSLLPTFF